MVTVTLEMIEIHFDVMFNEDYLLYIIIAYRMHVQNALYISEQLKRFLPTILVRVETMNYEQLALVFLSFVKR